MHINIYIQQEEAVSEPGGAGPEAAVLSASLAIEVLHGWQLHPGDVLNNFLKPTCQVVLQPVGMLLCTCGICIIPVHVEP